MDSQNYPEEWGALRLVLKDEKDLYVNINNNRKNNDGKNQQNMNRINIDELNNNKKSNSFLNCFKKLYR